MGTLFLGIPSIGLYVILIGQCKHNLKRLVGEVCKH